eukprot:9396108-Pyramimonas_sp.AAC.1
MRRNLHRRNRGRSRFLKTVLTNRARRRNNSDPFCSWPPEYCLHTEALAWQRASLAQNRATAHTISPRRSAS